MSIFDFAREHAGLRIGMGVWMLTGLAALFAAPGVLAAPIPLEPLGPMPAGESDLFSAFDPGNDLTVDWLVTPVLSDPGTGDPLPEAAFAYYYQLENTTGTGVNEFSVTLNPGTSASILTVGVVAGDDLDVLSVGKHFGHGPLAFPILITEEEPFTLSPVTGLTASLDLIDETVTWAFDALPIGDFETDTLYFLSTLPPTYGNAVAQDSIPPSPWTTLSPGSDMVPIPVPEPASVLLLFGGLAGLARSRRSG